MTDTMIERCARAIYEADDVWSTAFQWPQMPSSDQSADEYRRIARAAISAMMEPTEAMWEEFGADFEYEQFCGYWQRAITAALEEGK